MVFLTPIYTRLAAIGEGCGQAVALSLIVGQFHDITSVERLPTYLRRRPFTATTADDAVKSKLSPSLSNASGAQVPGTTDSPSGFSPSFGSAKSLIGSFVDPSNTP